MNAAYWAKRYRVTERAVMLCGLDRLPLMAEDARAFMLRDWDRWLRECTPYGKGRKWGKK